MAKLTKKSALGLGSGLVMNRAQADILITEEPGDCH